MVESFKLVVDDLVTKTQAERKEIGTMKRTLTLVLLGLFALLVSGCATVSTSGNYVLESGKTLRGDLMITSGLATLEEGSRVTGSVIMTSGVLNANGEIDGDIVLTSGNVNLGPEAVVHGDIRGTSGNVSQAEGARVEGRVSTNVSNFSIGRGFFARLFGLCCVLPLFIAGVLIVLVVLLTRRRPAAEPASSALVQSEPPAAPAPGSDNRSRVRGQES
jgi:hypothetical protein